jgi:hypothetical protein
MTAPFEAANRERQTLVLWGWGKFTGALHPAPLMSPLRHMSYI